VTRCGNSGARWQKAPSGRRTAVVIRRAAKCLIVGERTERQARSGVSVEFMYRRERRWRTFCRSGGNMPNSKPLSSCLWQRLRREECQYNRKRLTARGSVVCSPLPRRRQMRVVRRLAYVSVRAAAARQQACACGTMLLRSCRAYAARPPRC